MVSNYRPISLLKAEGKVFKELIFKYLFNHLQDNNLLSSLQTRFIPGDATITQLTFLYKNFCQAHELEKMLDRISKWAAIRLVSLILLKLNDSSFRVKITDLIIHLSCRIIRIPKLNSTNISVSIFLTTASGISILDYITDKASYRINILRKLKFHFDRKSLETNYKTFIRPLLEYGDILWDKCTQQKKIELDKIQNVAARLLKLINC